MDIYLVGGAVRDELLGIPVNDRDWVVTGATPDDMLHQGFKQVGADFPVFLHPKTREEYALARTERKNGHGYHGFKVYSAPDVTLEDDLKRRDLTINAMAKATDGTLIDPFNGQQDIESRQLRHVSDAFSEDPLRIFRIARFAARLAPIGFAIATETLALMKAMVDVGEVAHLAPERIWQETQRALHENEPTTFFKVLRDCDALSVVIPELDQNALFSPAMKALQRAHTQTLDTDARFASLLGSLDKNTAEHRARQMKAPNDCIALAGLTSALRPRITKEAITDPEMVLSVLDEADAWRRPERFATLLKTLACCLPENTGPQLEFLATAFEQARTVNAKALMAEGFEGKQLGGAIRNERLQRIRNS